MTASRNTDASAIKIKKYANRRLYNTATSSYVTLDHLAQMVKAGDDFTVHDAKTNEEITRQVLTQIIVEEEAKGNALLPISFLRKLISFYGGSMQWMVPSYLEYAMQAFVNNQEQMQDGFRQAFSQMFPFEEWEKAGRRNMEMMEQTMKMFTPPGMPGAGSAGAGKSAQDEFETLRAEIDKLQAELDRQTKG